MRSFHLHLLKKWPPNDPASSVPPTYSGFIMPPLDGPRKDQPVHPHATRSRLRKSLEIRLSSRGYYLIFKISLHDNGFKKMITSLTALMSEPLFISRASPLCHTTRGAGALSASRRWKRVSLGIRRGPSRKVKSRRRPARKDEDNLRRASFFANLWRILLLPWVH